MDIEVYSTTSEAETFRLGIELSKPIVPCDVLAFYGGLGAGKTELIKGICAGLSVGEIVSSPTFNIVNEYAGVLAGRAIRIYHIDLYRIENISELAEIGMEETLGDVEAVKLVEWAEMADRILPRERYDIKLTGLEDDNARRIEVIHRDAVSVNGGDGTSRVVTK